MNNCSLPAKVSTMRAEIGIIFLFVAVVYATETPASPIVNGVYDYHRRFGIPQAQKIKQIEDRIHSGERIAGGSLTTTITTPYQAGIIMTVLLFSSVCSGVLISPEKIITTGSCCDDGVLMPTSFTVVLGSNLLFTGGIRISEVTVIVHPEYNPQTGISNNIAIMRFSAVPTSLTVQPMETPLSTGEISNDYVGTDAVATGYGVTADGDSVGLLQTISSATLRVISNEECSRTYGGIIHNTHLCTSGTGGFGICDGDVGAPLVANVGLLFRRILIGIGSFYSAEGCQLGHPSGFTRITSFLGWIHSV